MQSSEQINELAASLAAAQGEFRQPHKTRTVTVQTRDRGSYTFSYAELDEIIDCVRGPLAKHGLAMLVDVRVGTSPAGGFEVSAVPKLIHASGQWLAASGVTLACESNRPQAIGSASTYARRYAITALLNLAADDDDDGNSAEGNQIKDSTAKGKRAPTAAEKKYDADMTERSKRAAAAGMPQDRAADDSHYKARIKQAIEAVADATTEERLEELLEKFRREPSFTDSDKLDLEANIVTKRGELAFSV